MIHLLCDHLKLDLFPFFTPIPVFPGTHEEVQCERGGKREEEVGEVNTGPGIVPHFS
jgi:hypothetical protein